MLIFVRKILFILIIVAIFVLFLSVLKGNLSFYSQHQSIPDNINNALYLLSTITESLSSILGVTVAALFITAQIRSRSQYGRTITEIYREPTTIFILVYFFVTIIFGIISIGNVGQFISSNTFIWLDINIILSSSALLMLGPLIIIQIENFDSFFLSYKLSKKITIRKILSYHLVRVIADRHDKNKAWYSLSVWGNKHGRHDPLGSFHELVMSAVHAKDRVLLSLQIRLMLKIIANCSSVPFRYRPNKPDIEPSMICKIFDFFLFVKEPKDIKKRIAITIHLFHYIIRRAIYLKEEWKGIGPRGLDSLRQQFILNIADLIESLNYRWCTEQIINICLFATMHICIAYTNIPRSGQHEALERYFHIAEQLRSKIKYEQADLCVEILAMIAVKTAQLPNKFLQQNINSIHPSLSLSLQHSMTLSQSDKKWLPGNRGMDPWRPLKLY